MEKRKVKMGLSAMMIVAISFIVIGVSFLPIGITSFALGWSVEGSLMVFSLVFGGTVWETWSFVCHQM